MPAALLAIIVLRARREPLLPPRAARPRMLIVAATVGIGFGLLSALALRHVSSVHGAVLTGLIPAATAGHRGAAGRRAAAPPPTGPRWGSAWPWWSGSRSSRAAAGCAAPT